MGAVEGWVREDLPGKMMIELKSNKCEMGQTLYGKQLAKIDLGRV